MTEQEAIRRLKDHFRIHDDGRPTPYLDEASTMAIKALEEKIKIKMLGKSYIIPKNGVWEVNGVDIHKAIEKQIPKKPYYEGDGYWDGELVYDYAKCPICGHDFEYGINDWESEYCSECGQKLDWSDEDE